MELRDLVIVGSGGHGKDTLSIVRAINDVEPTFNFLGYLDDGPVGIGGIEMLEMWDVEYVIGINSGAVRERIDRRIPVHRNAAKLVHPNAVIGVGCGLLPGAVVGAGSVLTSEVTVGRHSHINTVCSINQASSIGNYVTMSPGANVCGDCNIGDNVTLGAGSTVINLINIKWGATVGAGAVVINDVEEGNTVVGVPARPVLR